jgi:hypothetical protein
VRGKLREGVSQHAPPTRKNVFVGLGGRSAFHNKSQRGRERPSISVGDRPQTLVEGEIIRAEMDGKWRRGEKGKHVNRRGKIECTVGNERQKTIMTPVRARKSSFRFHPPRFCASKTVVGMHSRRLVHANASVLEEKKEGRVVAE